MYFNISTSHKHLGEHCNKKVFNFCFWWKICSFKLYRIGISQIFAVFVCFLGTVTILSSMLSVILSYLLQFRETWVGLWESDHAMFNLSWAQRTLSEKHLILFDMSWNDSSFLSPTNFFTNHSIVFFKNAFDCLLYYQ